MANADRILSVEPCARPDDSKDIFVCADRDDDRKYRLPLPKERKTTSPYDRASGEAARPSVALEGTAPCGIFQGQRHCGKKEAADYGYGGGRDPITMGVKLLTRIVDPDADLGPPAETPQP